MIAVMHPLQARDYIAPYYRSIHITGTPFTPTGLLKQIIGDIQVAPQT